MKKFMKRTFIIFALFVFGAIGVAAQSASPSPSPAPSGDDFPAVQEFLLTSAATDFYENQPPFPSQFRKVRIGHVGKNKKDALYTLCGEFLAPAEGGKAKWTNFVTIKTSGYEQYLGSSTTYCTNSEIIWHKTGDLSSALKSRLDSIKKKTPQ